MGKLVRAVRRYAARRYLPYNYLQDPPPRRRLPDAAVVMRDFHIVLNDLNIATRHRVMTKHDYEPEQTSGD